MLKKDGELNTSGSKEPTVTGSTGNGTQAEKGNTEAVSQLHSNTSPKEPKSSSPTPHELLLIFQEDIRLMQKAGILVEVAPEVKLKDKTVCGLVLKNVIYKDGNFILDLDV